MYQNNIDYNKMQLNCIVMKPENKTFISNPDKTAEYSKNIIKYEVQPHLEDLNTSINKTAVILDHQKSRINRLQKQAQKESSRNKHKRKLVDSTTLNTSIFNELTEGALNTNKKSKLAKNKKKLKGRISSKVKGHIVIVD